MYAYLVAGADADARAAFDRELYAPADGWEAAERRFFARLEAADAAAG